MTLVCAPARYGETTLPAVNRAGMADDAIPDLASDAVGLTVNADAAAVMQDPGPGIVLGLQRLP